MIRAITLAAGLLVAPAAMAQANPAIRAYDQAMIRKVAAAQSIDVKGAGADAVTRAPFLALNQNGKLDFRAVGAGCSGKGAKQICRTLVLEAEYNTPDNLDFEGYAASFNEAWKPTKLFWRGSKVVCALEIPLAGARKKQGDLDAALKDFASTAMALGGVMKQ